MFWLSLHTLLTNCQRQERLAICNWKVSPIPNEFQSCRRAGGNLWTSAEGEPRGSEGRTTSSLLTPRRTRTPLKIISVCVCFPLRRPWWRRPLDCVAEERLGSVQLSRRAGGRGGGASPNQQQYKSPSFHSSVWSQTSSTPTPQNLPPVFPRKAMNGSGDDAQIWCIGTQRRGICKRFSPPRTTNPTDRLQLNRRVIKCLDTFWPDKENKVYRERRRLDT